jgi:DNA-binding transcriptional LysR family regulator
MDRFAAMQLFTRIVDLGSFTAAAEDLRLPRPTVTYTVQKLEERLGVRLLNRTTRRVTPTHDGTIYYQRCQRLLEDLEEAEAGFTEAAANPRGRLRVDMQGALSRRYVIPRLPEFFERYPRIELDLSTGDRLVDLVRDGIDCVLRTGELRDSSLIARRIATLPEITCASTAYLNRCGEPQSLDDLRRHRAVNYVSSVTGKALPFEFIVDNATQEIAMKAAVSVTTADAYVACGEAGLGLIQVPRYDVEAQLARGELKEVLSQWRPAPMPVSVLYPHRRQLSPRVRVFVDWLAQLFAAIE